MKSTPDYEATSVSCLRTIPRTCNSGPIRGRREHEQLSPGKAEATSRSYIAPEYHHYLLLTSSTFHLTGTGRPLFDPLDSSSWPGRDEEVVNANLHSLRPDQRHSLHVPNAVHPCVSEQ